MQINIDLVGDVMLNIVAMVTHNSDGKKKKFSDIAEMFLIH